MALYRQDSTGFLCEFASNPGAGYTAVSAQPTDTLTNRVNWWRARDVDSALGQSTLWHPSLQGYAAESPSPIILSGSGINVCAWRYSTFVEADVPPLVLSSCTAAVAATGYISNQYLSVSASASNGTAWLNASSTAYNIALTSGKKWIISLWCAPATSGAKTFAVIIKTNGSGATYTLPLTTSATAAAWTRVSGVIDLTADASPKGLMALRVDTNGVTIRFDGIMMEEQIGDGTTPSAYFAPTPNINGSQLDDGSVPSAKVISLTVDKLVGGSITGQEIILANSAASIRSNNFVAGSSGFRIRGDGSAEFQNVTVRGSLNAADLVAGTIASGRFGSDTIGGSPIISGSLHSISTAVGTHTAAYVAAGSNLDISSCTVGSGLTAYANSNRTGVLLMATCTPTSAPPASGSWSCGFMRGFRTNKLVDAAFYSGDGQNASTMTALFFDSLGGTGTVTYYFGYQQNMSGTAQNLDYSYHLIEFSR